MRQCSQCDKQAIEKYNESYLCLDCLERISKIQYQRQEARHREILYNMQSANAAVEDMNAIIGYPLHKPPYDLSPFKEGHRMNVNTITLNDSVVGVISTAEVGSINVNLEKVKFQENGLEAANGIHRFMEVVLSCQDLDVARKNEILEQLEMLSEQASLPTQERKPGLVKAALSGIKESASTVGLLATTWQQIEPIFKSFFGA